MPFVKPMLASPLPTGFSVGSGGPWYAEEKYNGHRLLLEVSSERSSLLFPKTVRAWSRDGLDRLLPTHLVEAACLLPDGMYDGELDNPGKACTTVTALSQAGRLRFVLFDVLRTLGTDCTGLPYTDRRTALEVVALHAQSANGAITLSGSTLVESTEDVLAQAETVWARGGEGLILKQGHSTYVNKRSKAWIKIKKRKLATLEVVGFAAGKLGPFSRTLLQDADGHTGSVKTAAGRRKELEVISVDPQKYVGRMLVIEYAERTEDGNYFHCTWDRWEDE